MSIDKNDPRLTAYVLGELDDANARLVEVAVAEDAALRDEVDEIRATTELLTNALGDEPGLISTSDQAAKAEAFRSRSARYAPPLARWTLPLSVAAMIGVVFSVWHLSNPPERVTMQSVERSEVQYFTDVDSSLPTPSSTGSGAPRSEQIVVFRGREGNEEPHRLTIPLESEMRVLASESEMRLGNDPALQRAVVLNKSTIDARLPNAVLSGEGFIVGDPGAADASLNWARSPEESSRRLRRARPRTAKQDKALRQLQALGYTGSVEGYDEGAGDSIDGSFAYREQLSNNESYAAIYDNPFEVVDARPLSTFSIDVDTASYSNVRRFLTSGQLPPADAVRIEEMINYFSYDYPQPADEHPFSVTVETAECPWTPEHRIMRVGLKGYEVDRDERPSANLVFLIDVSGSMQSPNKLPLLVESLTMLAGELRRDDSVAIVVYAGSSGMALPATRGSDYDAIVGALENLRAGGSTNGGEGIVLAYDVAIDQFIEGGINRVILATDGDFNVGVTDRTELIGLIEDSAKSGVFLSVLGFGMGNYKDATLEQLADKGNGNYAYIDNIREAEKCLVQQASGTLMTIAKDVKIQVEFNPAEVSAYRLIGYENRMLAARDFNDDTKDAGEIGAGHTVTALYELVPASLGSEPDDVDPLRYQVSARDTTVAANSRELATVKLRYKLPDEDVSTLMEEPVTDDGLTLNESSDDFAFAAAVAAFGMKLRGSGYVGEFTFENVRSLAESALLSDASGEREELMKLIDFAARFAAGR